MVPPWALPIILPLGYAESYPNAWLAWVVLLAAAVVLSTRWLSSVYAVDQEFKKAQILLPFTFIPCLVCLKYAQIAPLLLLGAAGFLFFSSRKLPILAGMFLALTSFKPHLVYLVWLAVLFDAVRQRSWKVLTGAFSAIGLLTAVAAAIDHKVIGEYRESARLFALYPSAGGAILRQAFAHNYALLQFVPPVFGLAWFIYYWQRHRRSWDWRQQMPLILAVSMLTTAYGWAFDDTLLVVVLLALFSRWAGRIPKGAILLFSALNVALLVLLMLAVKIPTAAAIAFLLAPAVALLFLYKTAYCAPNQPSVVVLPPGLA
jgi:hypothetical protein